MAELELKQRVEEKVLNGILAKDPDERDKSLTELLSEENKQKAGDHFYKNLVFQNYELFSIYRSIMEFLLEDPIVREGVVVPRRIINPEDEDKKFLELYSVLAQFDQSLTDYKSFVKQNRSNESNIEAKLRSAEERLKIVQEKSRTAESKKASLNLSDENSKENHEAIKLDAEIKRYKNEEADIKEQKRGYEKRMAFLDRELEGSITDSPLRYYFNFALAKAKELGLEKSLSFEIPETRKDAEVSVNIYLLSRKIERIPIEFVPGQLPAVAESKKVSFLRRWKYAIGAGIIGIVLGSVLVYYSSKPKTLKIDGNIVSFNPQTMETETEFPGIDKLVKSKLSATKVYIPSEQYLPGEVDIVKFDPETKDITFRNAKCDNEELTRNLGENFDVTKTGIALVEYVQEGNDPFNVIERTKVYALDNEGDYGLIEGLPTNPTERDVPRREIMEHLRGIARDYKTSSLSEADLSIKGYKIVDAKYENGVLTLLTSQHGFDIPMNIEDRVTLSGSDFDNIPEALINGAQGHIYLDFSAKTGQVRVVEAGENFNSLLHFFPLPNLTPKF